MNRQAEIKANNKSLNFLKSISKQDNICDKQCPDAEMQDINRDNLRKFPANDEIIEAWSAGFQMEKKIALLVGTDENPRPDLQFNIMDDDDDNDDHGDDNDYDREDYGNGNNDDEDFIDKWLKKTI